MNIIISIFAFILGLGFLFNLIHIAWAMKSGKKVQENPWQSKTLEWQTASPPNEESFAAEPVVTGSFYDYDDNDETFTVPTTPGPVSM